jgi:uncharacterized protein
MKFASNMLKDAEGGHDWHHVERVMENARRILKKEKADKHIVLMGIILHDIADPKFSEGDETKGVKLASAFLKETDVEKETARKIMEVVEGISFKGGFNERSGKSEELKVAQDADRLDALGAIGIARAFSFGGFKGRKIYDPEDKPRDYQDLEAYRNSNSSTINHFYEKLLKLKDMMNTRTGKKMAEKRHDFMLRYLSQFRKEFEGNT